MLAAPVMAADLPGRAMAPAPAPVFVASSWAGAYIGAFGGLHFAQRNTWWGNQWDTGGDTPWDCRNTDGGCSSSSSFGGLLGLTVGYNMQSGNIVYGVEADAAALVGGKSSHFVDDGYWFRGTVQNRAFASIRGRVGIANNNTLFYATAGYGLLQTKLGGTDNGCDCYNGSKSSWKGGLVLGLGIEHALTANLSAKVEALYMPQTKSNALFSDSGSTTSFKSFRVKQNFGMIKFGLNYRFGGSASSVVARY